MARRHIAACAFLLAAVTLAAPARAAIELDPGEWQDTETGTENGEAVKPEVNSDCLSSEEAKDPVKSLMAMKGQSDGQCKTMDVKQSGNTVSFVMQCGDPKQMSFDIAATYIFIDRRHYTGTMKSTITMAGQKTTSDKKIESKWIGACKK